MRIFMVSNMYPSDKDRLFGVFVRNFKEEMEKLGVEFSKTAIIRGKSYSTIKKLGRYLYHYFNAWLGSFSRKYDLIYVHYLTHHIPVLLLILPVTKRPVVVNVHGSDINAVMHNKGLGYWAKIILKRIDRLVVPTPQFKEMILDKFPFMEKEQILVSPSGGIDKSLFYPAESPKSRNELTLGFISRLTEEKGWRTFLDALSILKKESVRFKAIIGGKGPDEEKLLQRITELELNDQVEFRGFIPQELLREVYWDLDIYVFPTFRDSLGLTGLEAMSCGIPVIASRIDGGPSTYVSHGFNGYLFTPRDEKALSEAIMEFCKLSELEKQAMADNALRTAYEYERTRVAEKLKDQLVSLVQ